MSSTLLEQTRATHEEVERLQRFLIDEMKRAPKDHKQNVIQSHNVNNALDRIIESSKRLERIYEDKDGSRKEEIASIGGAGPSLYSLFYDRLREIKDYHRRYPNVQVERPEDLHLPANEIPFTGDEGHGKYLDLQSLYTSYLNLGEDFKKVDYLTYVQQFYKFAQFPDTRFYNRNYKQYIAQLCEYLISFMKRAQPLLVLENELGPAEKEFEEKWKANPPTIAISAPNGDSADNNNNNTNNNNNSDKSSSKSTPNANKNKKKNKKNKSKTTEAPTAPPTKSNFKNPLYCRVCGKLYSKDTVFQGHLNGKKHIAAEAAALEQYKEISLNEVRVDRLGELLGEQIVTTKSFVEKKLSMSYEERQAELELEEKGGVEEEEEEEEEEPVRMTIENYPIGWDGKPIPYWLYKLHGLGIEYKCEICGNTSYFGRKAFEKHFQEWRHAHGMSCLGIPNTIHFQEITKIQDAQALWAKLKVDGQKVSWRPDHEEEFEDIEGHVMNKKTFEDLRKQGLLNL